MTFYYSLSRFEISPFNINGLVGNKNLCLFIDSVRCNDIALVQSRYVNVTLFYLILSVLYIREFYN